MTDNMLSLEQAWEEAASYYNEYGQIDDDWTTPEQRARWEGQRILSLPMPQPNDAYAETIQDYLLKLLRAVWEEEIAFEGKRPFGNSDWQYEVYLALALGGYQIGDLDEYGLLEPVDNEKADRLIYLAIDALYA